jgi:hypothetical protein
MNVGKLYQVKKYYWMLYPLKDKAAAAVSAAVAATAAAVAATAAAAAAYYSEKYNCYVSYISPNSIFVFLEKDEKVIKILSTNGEVGWIYLSDFYKDDIKEVNQ